MNSGDSGSFTRLRYDRCAHQKDTFQSVEPLQYQMYGGKYESCSKCTDKDSFYRPIDAIIVDTESELKGITRANSRCPQYKYSPYCKKSKSCTSTFDKSMPVVLAPENCPIVRNNIPRISGPGYELNTEPFCAQRMVRNPQNN